jgi:gluconokinase
MCLSGAMHSLFPAGADGEPLAPATTWADVRAGAVVEALRRRCDPHGLYLRTGCPLRYLYYPARLYWHLQQQPELHLARFAALKDYILYKLCGVWGTDHGLASGTGMLDIHKMDWDEEALALSGLSRPQLPELLTPFEVVGKLSLAAARLSGFPQGLPIVIGAGDGGLANLGSGAVRPGQSIITVGTSGAVRRIIEQPVLDEAERTWCYVLFHGRWYHGGASNNAGLAVQWVRERFYPDIVGSEGYECLFGDAASISPGAEGVVLVPYFAGERNPHWDANARGVIAGLALEHDRRQVARAVLEGAAFCLADIWEALGPGDEPIRLTGMINSWPVWAQIVSDVIGVRLAGLAAHDASAVGAAMLGHFGIGSVQTLEEISLTAQPDRMYVPDRNLAGLYAEAHKNFRSLYRG